MTDWILYTALGLLVGLVVGLFVGVEMGADVATEMYPPGIEGVWLNKTAATNCTVDYVNQTAEVYCNP